MNIKFWKKNLAVLENNSGIIFINYLGDTFIKIKITQRLTEKLLLCNFGRLLVYTNLSAIYDLSQPTTTLIMLIPPGNAKFIS